MRSALAVTALVAVLQLSGAARADTLLPAGDTDGDLRGDVLWVAADAVSLLLGADLDGAPRWILPIAADATVVMAGDVDGDGRADVAIGEPGIAGTGRVQVVLGAEGAPVVTLLGEDPGDRFGAAIAAADLDGDGLSELVVGAPGRPPTGWIGVFYGAAGGPGPFADEVLLGWRGAGARLERVWDVDGDGRGDVLARDGEAGYLLSGGPDGLRVGAIYLDATELGPIGDRDGDARADLGWWRGAGPTDQGPDETVVPAGDLDGDFVADVVIRGVKGARAVSGARTAGERRLLGVGEGLDPAATPLGDVDGDGFADLGWLSDDRVVVWHGHGTLFGAPVAAWRPPFDPTPPQDGVRVVLVAQDSSLLGAGQYKLGESWPLAVGLPDADVDGRVDNGAVALVAGGDARVGPEASPVVIYPYEEWCGRTAGAHVGSAVATGLMTEAGQMLIGAPGGGQALPFDAPADAVAAPAPGAGLVCVVWREAVALGTAERAGRGSSVVLVGDVDGDALGDIVEVAPGIGPPNGPVGEVRLYRHPAYGAGGSTPIPSGLSATPSWSTRGTSDAPIRLVASAGDLNGDALADFAVAQPDKDHVEVYFRLTESPAKNTLALLPPPLGPGAHFGATLAAAGDLDGDGYGDLAVGAPDAEAGYVAVYYGGPTVVATTRTLVLAGDTVGERFGATLGAAGDVDGDGFADLAVGAPDHGDGRGRVVLYRGGPGGLAPSPAWELVGERANAHLGLALSSHLDWNDDGFGDLAVAQRDAPGQPVVLIFAGNDNARGRRLPRAVGAAFGAVLGETVVPWARAHIRDAIGLETHPLSPFSGALVLDGEVRPSVVPSSDVSVGTYATRAMTGQSRVVQVYGLQPDTPYQWRVRARFPTADAPLQPTSRWIPGGIPGQPSRVHFRTAANRPPIGAPDRFRATASELVVRAPGVLLNDFDGDRDRLTAEVVQGPTRGRVAMQQDGGFTYTAVPGDYSDVTFSYRVRDAYAVSEPVTVTLELRPCSATTCADGVFSADLQRAGGEVGSVRCVARYDLEPPAIRCDVDAEGAVSLPENPACD